MPDQMVIGSTQLLVELMINMGIPESAIQRIVKPCDTVTDFSIGQLPTVSTNSPLRRVFSDGLVNERDGMIRVEGGTWVIICVITPTPLNVRIDEVRFQPMSGGVVKRLGTALARIVYKDLTADYRLPTMINEPELVSYWLAGKFSIHPRLNLGEHGFDVMYMSQLTLDPRQYVFRRRRIRDLTDYNHFDGWSEPSVPQVVERLIRRHGRQILQPWSELVTRDQYNLVGDYDGTLSWLRLARRRGMLANALDEHSPGFAKVAVLTHGYEIWNELWSE